MLAASVVLAQPTRHGRGPGVVTHGPAMTGAGPAAVLTTATTTTTLPSFIVPAAGAADANCPNTIPTQNATQASVGASANQGQTCATGSNAGGYDVLSISLYVGTAVAGNHVACSLYDGASPKNHIAAGCDTTPATVGTNPSAYITMNTTGACHIAATTRYWIACNTDTGGQAFGFNTTSCTACWQWVAQTYGTWPATLAAGSSSNWTPAYYMTVH